MNFERTTAKGKLRPPRKAPLLSLGAFRPARRRKVNVWGASEIVLGIFARGEGANSTQTPPPALRRVGVREIPNVLSIPGHGCHPASMDADACHGLPRLRPSVHLVSRRPKCHGSLKGSRLRRAKCAKEGVGSTSQSGVLSLLRRPDPRRRSSCRRLRFPRCSAGPGHAIMRKISVAGQKKSGGAQLQYDEAIPPSFMALGRRALGHGRS